MIKFAATSDEGKKIVGLGISEANVQELKKGRPILVRGEDVEISEDIFIFYGETEESMKETLKQFIGPETRVHE